MQKQNLVLVGFRGTGKTVFGREVAKVLNLPFADLDAEVEFVLGESIDDFVEKHGWQQFREVEQRVAHDFSRNFSGIVATGAGAIENSKNLQNLKKTGNFLWMNPKFSDVRKFLLKDTSRPRLNPDISLAQEIDQMWAQRKDIYSAIADHEVCPDIFGDPAEEARKIAEQIPKNFLPPTPKKKRVAVFSSSRGTVFRGILEARSRGRVPNVEFVLFVSDRDCEAVEVAKKAGVSNIQIVKPRAGEEREEYDREIINLLRAENPDVICCLGWMRIFSKLYCEQFGSVSWNVHPSLLPAHAGLMNDEVHRRVLENEEKWTGCTIHRIEEKVDAGETVVQRKILVNPEYTIEDLKLAVQKQEILGFCEALERK